MPRKSEKHDTTSFTVPSVSRKRYVPSPLSAPESDQLSARNASIIPLASPKATSMNASLKGFSSPEVQILERSGQALPELFNLQALLEQSPAEPEWIVTDLLPVGVSLLAGFPRIDKPLLAHQLGLSVATGSAFLSRFPVQQGRVLYLALTENFQQVCSRATRLLRGQRGASAFTVALKWASFRENGLADLEDAVTALADTRLIIVDPLELVLPLQPATSYRMRQPMLIAREPGFFLPLRELAMRYHMSILLLHHLAEEWSARLADPLAGSSSTGLTSASACNLLLMPTNRSDSYTLQIAGSQIEERRLTLTLNTQQGCWCIE